MHKIIHHVVITLSGENVWCRLRSISDRPTDIPSGESNFYCLRMRLWRLCERVPYGGMPPSKALAAREEEAGLRGI